MKTERLAKKRIEKEYKSYVAKVESSGESFGKLVGFYPPKPGLAK